jgi:hypothetical protein
VAKEPPPTQSPSTGVAFLTFNKDNSNLCYAISYTPLAGTEILAHFHGPAMKGDVAGPGVASPVLHNITNGTPPGPSPVGSPKQGCVVVSDKQQQKDLKNGLWYINVHATGPSGKPRRRDPRPGAAAEDQVQERARDRDHVDHHTDDFHDHDDNGRLAERRVRRLNPGATGRRHERPYRPIPARPSTRRLTCGLCEGPGSIVPSR